MLLRDAHGERPLTSAELDFSRKNLVGALPTLLETVVQVANAVSRMRGSDIQKPVRDARNAQRAKCAASGGIGVPCSALARVQAISRFCARQIIPQAFSSISRPMPPPILIARCPLDDCGFAFSTSTIQEAATAMAAIAIVRTHGLLRIPLCGN